MNKKAKSIREKKRIQELISLVHAEMIQQRTIPYGATYIEFPCCAQCKNPVPTSVCGRCVGELTKQNYHEGAKDQKEESYNEGFNEGYAAGIKAVKKKQKRKPR